MRLIFLKSQIIFFSVISQQREKQIQFNIYTRFFDTLSKFESMSNKPQGRYAYFIGTYKQMNC